MNNLNIKILYLLVISSFLIFACNNQQETTDTNNPEHSEQEAAVEEKMNFITGYGDYEFKISGVYQGDSTTVEIKHKGTDMEPGTFEVKLPGKLKGAFSGDVSGNYKPELYLWSRTDEKKLGNAIGFEFRSELLRLNFPSLTENYASGYFGRDSFYLKQDHFIRTFPLFEEKNGEIMATENKRTLWYTLNDIGTLILIN